MFRWFRQLGTAQKLTFWACFGGWALDALDLQVFSQVIPTLITQWGISKAQAGWAGGISLFSLSLGGWLGGAAGDRWGRVRMLKITVLWFSAFTLLTALSGSFDQLLVYKALQGLGFGGEWAIGAALLAEALPTEIRGRALGLVQSAWAVGWGAAVLIFTVVFLYFSPHIAWRVLFAAGAVPGLFVLYLRRNIPEPARQPRSGEGKSLFALSIFSPQLLPVTIIGALFGIGARGGYYGLMTWLPAYLQSDRHLSLGNSSAFLVVIIVAFWCGCACCAVLMDKFGRRNTVMGFSLCCLITVFIYMYAPLNNSSLLVLGFPLGLFAAGVPASMGAWFSELYPQYARGAGVGFCYCFGGIVASTFPAIVGKMSEYFSLGVSIAIITCTCYLVVLITAALLKETGSKRLDPVSAS